MQFVWYQVRVTAWKINSFSINIFCMAIWLMIRRMTSTWRIFARSPNRENVMTHNPRGLAVQHRKKKSKYCKIRPNWIQRINQLALPDPREPSQYSRLANAMIHAIAAMIWHALLHECDTCQTGDLYRYMDLNRHTAIKSTFANVRTDSVNYAIAPITPKPIYLDSGQINLAGKGNGPVGHKRLAR